MSQDKIFLHKLCIELGYHSTEDLKEQMSQREFQDWIEFYNLYPFQADRAELGLSYIAEAIYKVQGAKEVSYMDFMITISEKEKEVYKERARQAKLINDLDSF